MTGVTADPDMLRFTLRKLVETIPVLLLVSFATAALTDLIPTSPGRMVLGEFATEERVQEFNDRVGANDPFLERYWSWLSGAVRGDLGTSWISNQPVTSLILDSLWPTVEIAIVTLVCSLAIAIGAALVAAGRATSVVDRAISGVGGILQAVPSFVAAIVVTRIVAVQFELLPPLGWTPIGDGLGAHLESLAMPVMVMVAVTAPLLYRVLRADLVDVLQQDYVLSARARGLTDAYILVRHVLRPASKSLLTLTGLLFGFLIGGSIIVETFFVIPGLGGLVSRSMDNQDLVILQGVVLYVAAAFLLINAAVDVLQAVLDPRLRTTS